MTPDNQNELRTIIREEVNTIVHEVVNAAKAELIETMRDMQTEMIRGMERFARGNFARMHRLEVSDNDLVERINALEERTLALESRLPPFNPPPA